jgi:hypothetical protein
MKWGLRLHYKYRGEIMIFATFLRKAASGLLSLGLACLLAVPVRAETWIRAESDNFSIYSTAPEKTTREYIKKLEVFRNLTNLLLGSSDSGPKVRFEVYLMQNSDDLQRVRPSFSKRVAGVYFNCGEGSSAYGAVSNDGDSVAEEDEGLIVLFHEYSHYIMFQHAKSYYPAWYVEGFADYLATAYPANGKITLGEPSKMRGSTLSADRWIGFDKVLKPSFGFAGDKSNEAWEVESFYAQSWLLAHYMLSDPKRARDLNTYFAEVGKGADPVASFEAATGLKVNQLESTLQRYRQQLSFLTVPVPSYPDSRIKVTKLNAATSSYLLDRSLLTTCMQPDQGRVVLSRLEKAKGGFVDDIDYQFALTRAHLLYGNAQDAEAIVGPVVLNHPESFEANYLMGRVYQKMAQTANEQERNDLIEASQGFFIAAYENNRLSAPNLYYLARSYENRPDFPDANVLNAATGAHVLAPAVKEYAIFAAQVNLAKGNRSEAITLLTPFVGNPHDRKSAERFQKAIDAIKDGKSAKDVMQALKED